MSSLPRIGRLASGEVVVDRPNSHLHEGVLAVLPRAFTRLHSNNRPFFVAEVEFDEVVGKTVCVETDASDEIVYARRPGRKGYSRFVKGREPEPCRHVTVILKRASNRDPFGYLVISAFIGRNIGPEPWDPNASPEAIEAWHHHALVWGEEQVIEGTETTECPW